jgi:hypothetical protein
MKINEGHEGITTRVLTLLTAGVTAAEVEDGDLVAAGLRARSK